jgi:hypothetical protein
MFDSSAVPDLSRAVLGIGALGTAAFGLVDATKSLWGGVSNRGFGDIRKVIATLIPPSGATLGPSASQTAPSAAISLGPVLETLRANWLNGMSLADQKAIAKAMIKLNLTPASASKIAVATGVDTGLLTSAADKMAKGVTDNSADAKLTPAETDILGRFDLILSAMLDRGYQRADQRYRNSAKALAVLLSVALAFLGSYSLGLGYHKWTVLMVGLLATPLAPIAKDVASAIQAGAKAVQSVKR